MYVCMYVCAYDISFPFPYSDQMAGLCDAGPAGGGRGAPGGALRGREPVHHPRPPRHHHAQGHSARPQNTRTTPGVAREERNGKGV